MLVLNKSVKGRINDCKYMKIIYVNCGSAPSWLVSSVGRALPMSQRSWVQIPYKPKFFSGLIFTTA